MNRLALAAMALSLTSCKYDRLRDAYYAHCPEAQSVRFETLTGASLCKGVPILIALARNPGLDDGGEADDLIKEIADERSIDFDVQEPGTGKSALMVALENGHVSLAPLIFTHSKNPSYVDPSGRHFLHYLAAKKWRWQYEPLLKGVPLDIRSREGQTAAQIAYGMGQYSTLWVLLRAGADSRFLQALTPDPSFLFDYQAAEHPEVLDLFPAWAAKKYTGTVTFAKYYWSDTESRDVVNYGLAEHVATLCSAKLALYLNARGIFKGEIPVCEGDSRSNTPSLVYSYAESPSEYGKRSLLEQTGETPHPMYSPNNELKQNGAHAVLAFFTKDHVREVFGSWLFSGRGEFLSRAGRFGWFDQEDVLGNKPIHTWFANPRGDADLWYDALGATKDIATLNYNRDSVLSLAVKTGRSEIVRVLWPWRKQLRSVIGVADVQGKTPGDWAKETGNEEIQRLLRFF